ncbi:type VI secretion system baseplate subunit TssF [Caulobacter sp. CCUG 60055]|uniref:type VI secretion system baseplate subunit TssF n=1 Tax=Caulobacter sp. CCUG 60055 TaxID=2100090 RepID=UPI001FA7C97B|nr:type VI secretion system baseplate subunit TssF [Caulobacter sp. CCUG 60055]MCI3179455.1 type VI secretion system baseplate subunit TssF [Caulobacter sp. CCUG 60055]
MDPRLLRAYNEELLYLRETAREFGEEYETVAGRLGLNTPTDSDPYVERLLEGVAFLGARVRLKLQDQFPDFTQHLLSAIQPHYLSPTPSMCVAAFEPQEGDQAIATGFPVPRLTEMSATSADDAATPVIFRTGQDVTLWPIRITEAEYLPTRAAVAAFSGAAGVRAEAGLRLKFSGMGGVPLSAVAPPTLPIYLDGSEMVPGELYRQLIGDGVAVVARSAASAAGEAAWVKLPLAEQHGFEEDCALLPNGRRSFRGYRILSEYFACPERFLFVRLAELGKAFARCDGDCEVVFLFNRAAATLAGAVSPANFRLFATPAINLFEKQIDRVAVNEFDHEHQLIADRTKPLDFEIFRALEVTAYSQSNGDARPVAPLHAFGSLLYDWTEALFYVTRLRHRRLSTKEQRLRRRADYLGTETWISLVAPGEPRRLDGVYELAVRALVTNRELAETLRLAGSTDFRVSGIPVRAVTVVRAPTKPRPPMGISDGAWRIIGHLTPNYASFALDNDDDPSVLRDHLALYGRIDDPMLRRQIDGVLAIRSEPVTRRVAGPGRSAFARGQRLRIKLDDAPFENSRMFLFSAVLERFLGEFATVNAFTECTFESPQEGIFAQWPPRMGERRNI